jgi:hypothetical protein
MKTAHRREVVGEGVRMSCFQLLDEELHVGGDEFLFGVGLLAVDGGGVGCAAHGVFSFAVAFAFHAMRGMYLHAERLLAKAGVASARRGGSPTLAAQRKGRRAAQAERGSLGRLLARAGGCAPERT